MGCPICAWSGWVCENHTDRPSEVTTKGGCACAGAAVPCTCNPEAVFNGWVEIFASVDQERVSRSPPAVDPLRPQTLRVRH
ncbi:hypothetical protein C7T35_33190 [Variovorax sp. WS11]|nr:hypothetical protein C7T35_33190 [Variovorax sp. WS11]